MPVHNPEIVKALQQAADLLEIEGANPFRVRAYRNAARTVEELSQEVFELLEQGKPLTELSGIGKDLAGKIREIVETGTFPQLEAAKDRTPPALGELLEVQGLGPERVRALYRELGVTDRQGLRKAAEAERVRELDGFGPKTERKILSELEKVEERKKRTRLDRAEGAARDLVSYLETARGVQEIAVAGSFRRRCQTVGDLDILVTCGRGRAEDVMERFVRYDEVDEVVSRGETRSTVTLRSGLQVDLRAVGQASYGAALHYFTGSKAHNIAVRRLGQSKGLKVNEYGVFRGDDRIAGKTEEEVYGQVGLPYIEPELREDRGELEAAREGRLPELVTLDEIRGDLHAHTVETDGRFTLEEMAEAAREKGYGYLAISNHSKRVAMVKGYDADRLAQEIDRIDELNEKLEGFRVLKSIEVDILKDGSLDLSNDILGRLDLTVCSVHYDTNLSREQQTERILRAMDNPLFHILAHPTGRLLGQRDPYEVDLERVMRGAAERGCFLEVNAHPERLDLDDVHCKLAKELGVKVAISTDAHSLADLDHMRFGVWQARRGWLEAEDVLNTRAWTDLRKLLRR
ncbi:MAG: DNA polymerase/3'-5' exonuclease PolX [Deferrisomatales bacterium]|nr:DNA polymerase/3'-5' exonuclease PolX [Deferrisomatales bacterium]